MLEPVKDTLPVLVVQGGADEQVPVKWTRRWIDWMDANGMSYEYLELPGANHGEVIELGMSNVFAFFAKQIRAAP